MTVDDEQANTPDAPRRDRRGRPLQSEPTARQLVIPALVAFLSVVALVAFIYGFCTARGR